MKIHAYSKRTNNMICASHKGNGNSIEIKPFLNMEKENKTSLCFKCLSILKQKKKLYI